MSDKEPFKFKSKAQHDFFRDNKPNTYKKIMEDGSVDVEKLPDRLHDKDMDVIRIPLGDDKVYNWKLK
jgi:hypothetical protein